MSTATLNDIRVPRVRVQIPAHGVWWADVELDVEATLTGGVTLAVADLTLQGVVVSGGPYQGSSRYRIAGGKSGWGETIAKKDYANDAGVKFSTVLGDAANDAGETLDATTIPTGTVGTKFVRAAGPASRVLEQLVPRNWYVGVDGVTKVGKRAAVELKGEATRVKVDLARSTLELAADEIAELVPGVIVDGIEAVDVQHELVNRTLRTTIWGAGIASAGRRLEAFRRLINLLLPDYRFRGVYEYRVSTQEGERLNLQAVRSSLGLPDLRRVKVRPGIAGVSADVTLGCLVLVTFVDADPTRPVVIAFEDAEGGGFMPLFLDLGSGVTLGVARVTDPVQAGPFTGVITAGSLRVRAGL